MSLPSRVRPLALASALLLAALVGAPAPARAWTQAHVTGVAARLDATLPSALRVALDVQVQVTGGWLSQLQIATHDPGLSLSTSEAPVLRAVDGTLYTPTASVDPDGGVTLSFDNRHSAPWRGQYVATVTYDTAQPLAQAQAVAGGALRVRWSLPGWEVGLSNVQVTLRAPAGTLAAVSSNGQAYGDQMQQHDHDGVRELGFTRVQLPRTEVWQLAFDLPSPAVATRSASTALQPTAADHGHGAGRLDLGTLGLCLGLCLLALTKQRLTRRACHEHGLRALPLLPLPSSARNLALLAGCVVSGSSWQSNPVAAACAGAFAIACMLDRAFVRSTATASPSARPACADDLAQCQRRLRGEHLTAPAWLDATTLPGLATLLCMHSTWLLLPAGTLHDAALLTGLLATPLWLTATRLHKPASAARNLQRLAACAARLPMPTQLMLLTADDDGRWLAAQLQLPLPAPVHGTPTLALVAADSSLYGRPHAPLAWLTACDTGSAADGLLATALPDARSWPQAERTLRLSVTACPEHDAPQLAAWLSPKVAGSEQLERAA